ncbi:MAG: hypothetical protein EOO20_20845 [Chryseobacterium sp.]|nr:MAG: hypothetical protein EOO20_20845 [Chryseobacterium sp.]
MQNEDEKKQAQDTQHQNANVKPDPETLHKTDPQENMSGPLSSLVNKAADAIEGNDDDKTKEEADEKREKNM